MSESPVESEKPAYRRVALATRSLIGGALMGLANLVPGISGGTMLLAAGVYPNFIDGVAEVSTFRFRRSSLLTLACILGGALVAIATLAGVVGGLVVDHRWVMYSLFIGLTLGGVPLLWAMLRPLDSTVVVAATIAIAAMAALAIAGPVDDAGARSSTAMLFLAGLAGASAMVLPGISGGYLLLLLGQYVAILTAIDSLAHGVADRDTTLIGEAMGTVIPVGVGVVVGVVGISNLVKVLLQRCERPTLGVLLGLLLGAIIGLWPFQTGVAPEVGSTLKGDRVVLVDGELRLENTGRVIEAGDYPTQTFRPSAGQLGGAAGLVVLGFLLSAGIAHLGQGRGDG
ncbi:MAG: DUF368 domain-containing protein [Phycisphaerae bacterium]|nr:DUF368 domain-containing protein [Phycisphaerae bacterium]NNF44658.1 DUF368 domain-containing protein [Phycisphaerales bacterium]